MKTLLSKTALVHDALVYAAAYAGFILADTPVGAGWDALLAAAPVAASQVVRLFLTNEATPETPVAK